MKTAIVFIDGNNLYHNLKHLDTTPSRIDMLKLSQIICSKLGLKCIKTKYYNSIPSILDGEEKYNKHMQFINSLKSLPTFEVYTRKLQRMSNKEIIGEKAKMWEELGICTKCEMPVKTACVMCVGLIDRKEKGIDVKLAIDMVSCALKEECDVCVLVSGDADFIPAIDIIKENGREAVCASTKPGFSWAIRQSQQILYITDDVLSKCLKVE